jgi:hypothetical protein
MSEYEVKVTGIVIDASGPTHAVVRAASITAPYGGRVRAIGEYRDHRRRSKPRSRRTPERNLKRA